MVVPTSLDTRTPLQDEEVPVVDDDMRGRNPCCNQKPISHQNMTQHRMTRQLDTEANQHNAYQPEWERLMMPLLQTSAHYPKTSKQVNRSASNQCRGTLSASSIQEHADNAKRSPSTMTHGIDVDQSRTPPRISEAGTDQSRTSSDLDQKWTALTTLGIITTAILLVVQGNQRRRKTTSLMSNEAMAVSSVAEQTQRNIQSTECPKCGHGTQEELPYKSPPKHATSSPSKSPVLYPTPTTPPNSPTTSPCLLPSLTPRLQLRSEDSGSKEKWTTTPGKDTTSSTHGEVTTIAATPGTVAR